MPAAEKSLAMTPAEAFSYSRYAARMLSARPQLSEVAGIAFSVLWLEQELRALAPGFAAANLAVAIRELRQRVMLAVLVADLTGRAALADVCAVMSRLASFAVERLVEAHERELTQVHGHPIGEETGAPQKLIVIGMGKLGGGELNVSSDIDLVFVFPEQGDTDGGRRIANQDFFERLGRRLIRSLAEITADGFVFRVDMRLRPYGDSGALATSFAGLEQYLTTQGRTWERYAWLKARALTGDRGNELAALVEPFVFRKYLDFDAYDGLRDVHRQIREQARAHAGNIKLGAGGIREIEFMVQALQLIRGGREPALRVRGTMAALDAIEDRGLLPDAVTGELRRAYDFLRRVEHRLQYRDDQQTHDLPAAAGESDALALACGFPDTMTFEVALKAHRRTVAAHFESVFGAGDPMPTDAVDSMWRIGGDDDDASRILSAMGFPDPASIVNALKAVRASGRYSHLPALSRTRFDALVPRLLRTAAASEQPGAVAIRLLNLLETVSGRSAYLALLLEHPPVLPRLAHLMGASAWAADYLTRHPILLDELLDSRSLLMEPDWASWREELDEQVAAMAGDAERQMDALRHFQHAQTFRLLAQDVENLLSVERLTDHLSALADTVLATTLAACWEQVRGATAGAPRFAIIGYGKLGGRELGYASDLDLVFLYDASEAEQAEGAQALYARLGQRINTWLNSMTAAGRLYETDLRLRPDGASGLLVSRLGAFREYERAHAWTWEHQALTRARFVAGDAAIGVAFEAEREAILRQRRERKPLCEAVVVMRRRMQAGHPNPTSLFDLKHDPGGMVDVEFAVQNLVLGFGHEHAELVRNTGNIALLLTAGELGLVDPALARTAADAYREYRRLQHRVRLQGASQARVEGHPLASGRAAVFALWQAVFDQPREAAAPGRIG